ncbi:MAG: hypothetical protein KIT09_34750 [Bryobacteraceae bacterium]|nr:hypothetical protein [Bryobacteraceae bacterium]
MSISAFGNHPAKVGRYRAFWNLDDVRRPLVGFSFIGWFPLGEFSACKSWGSAEFLTPEMIDIGAFVEDHLRMLREGETLDDDVIRGACPAQVAVPWLPGMLGCKLRILPQNVLGDERRLSWDEALAVRLDAGNPWYRKYLEFADALAAVSGGRFPVSHSPEIGPTDLHAVLRGHSESILDLADEPEKSAELLFRLGEIFREITKEIWRRLPLYCGGYFDAQYSLWAPGPIIRMQEDATAVYSPALYRRFVQPVDRMLAAHFPSSFIHLHSTSMFLLDAILEIEEIQCYEVNNDAAGPPLAEMVPYFQQIQRAGKPLLIRGAFAPDEMRLLMDSLEPRGLFLNIMVNGMSEVEALRPLVGM